MLPRQLLFAFALVASFLAAACQQQTDATPDIEYISSPGTSGLPFSAAVRVGHTLYISGNIGIKPGAAGLVSGGIAAETRQTLENIKATVELAGSSMAQVVKCSVFLADVSEWSAMNEVYITYFNPPPARSAFGANGLALGARVEIECIAVVG